MINIRSTLAALLVIGGAAVASAQQPTHAAAAHGKQRRARAGDGRAGADRDCFAGSR